jgi:predicted kinase
MSERRRGRGTVVALEGISGAGKSTLAARLAGALDAELLPEAYARLRPPPSLDLGSAAQTFRLEHRLLAEEARRYREADQIAGGGRSVVADTGFLGPLTYTLALVELGDTDPEVVRRLLRAARELEERHQWGMPDRVLWLETTAPERARRVAADAEGHPARWAARHERAGRVEERLYRECLGPVLGARIDRVPASGGPELVLRRLLRALGEGPRTFAPESMARRTLDALEASARPLGNR